MQILDALGLYLQQLLADGRADATRAQAARHVRLLDQWLTERGANRDVAALDHELVAAFLASPAARLRPDGSGKKASSLNCLRSSVRGFAKYLHQAGFMEQDPARLVRRARCGPGPPRALSDDELRRLFEVLGRRRGAAARRDEALARLLAGAGLRLGEALALDVEDLELDGGVAWLTNTKAGAPDRAFLPRDLVEQIRGFLGSRVSGPLFRGHHGERITARHARRRLVAAMERAGVRRPANPHQLRHTFATRLLGRTGDLRLVQAALRHRSIASTTIYTAVGEGRLREALQAPLAVGI